MCEAVSVIYLQVDNDGLHDLNVQANWQQKGGTYWVRFCHCELLGDIDTAGVMAFKPGDKIRVKRAVTTPKYAKNCGIDRVKNPIIFKSYKLSFSNVRRCPVLDPTNVTLILIQLNRSVFGHYMALRWDNGIDMNI